MTLAAIRVLITDPHPVVIAGIRSFLQADKGIRVVGAFTELWEVPKQCAQLRPDVILVGHRLDEARWRLLSRSQTEAGIHYALLGMSSNRDPVALCQAIRGGCRGMYDKTEPLEHLISALRKVYGGGMYFRDNDTHLLIESLLEQERSPQFGASMGRGLTDRQERIISLVARGLTNAEIAEAVRVSQATVALDLTHIYRKLGVPDRVRLLIKVQARTGPASSSSAISDANLMLEPQPMQLVGSLPQKVAASAG